MLARILGVECSKRCQLLLSMAYQDSPKNLLAIARHLVSDRGNGALRLAESLNDLPVERGTELTAATLKAAGILNVNGK